MSRVVIAKTTIQGVKFYTCEGAKFSGDERLFISTVKDGKEGPQIPLATSHLAFAVDHYAKNEDKRYSREEGCLGGDMIIRCLKLSWQKDWQSALAEYGVRVPRGVIYD